MIPEFTNVGNITVIQAALGVTERDYASVESLLSTQKAAYTPTDGAKEAEVRFITPADADGWVVELYAAKTAYDHYTRMATLTLTGGTQVHSSGKVFVDTLVGTNEAWLGGVIWVKPQEIQSAVNMIARYSWLLKGYKRFLFIASTIEAGKRLEVEVAEIN